MPFAPTDLSNLVIWLDFSDTGTITDAGGGAVSQVLSKDAGSKAFVQGTANRRPTTGTRTLNSLNVLDFSTSPGGEEDRIEYRSTITFSSNNGAVTIYVVCRADTSFSTYTSPFTGDDSNDSSNRMTQGFRMATHTGLQLGWFNTASSAFGTGDGTFTSATTEAIYSGIMTGTVDKHLDVYRNSTHSGTQGTITGTPRTAGNDWGVGLVDFADPTHSWDGIVAEVIVYNADHDSTGDRTTVENYLGAKWGIAGYNFVSASAGNAAGTGTAYNAGGTVSVGGVTAATGTGVANDPTVSTVPTTNASAGNAAGTGASNVASAAISVSAGIGSGSGTAYVPSTDSEATTAILFPGFIHI